ncbi:MAG: calcium/sodium antiporter [Eubacteriales bacterium]|nr:calcium/sodium antiporter [Eubacteriales bacterium]
MKILLDLVLLLVGFVFLIKGADYFVEGSAAVAKKFNIPGVVIGLTIVAMGTSAPELAVSVSAGIAGSNALAISNVIGSNIFNLMVVLGVCAILSPVAVEKDIVKRDFPFSLIATVLVGLFISDIVFKGSVAEVNGFAQSGTIRRWEAVILLIFFVMYMYITVRSAIKNREAGEEIESLPVWKSLTFIILGAAAIIGGGQLVVNSAKAIALFCGMSETLVGLTIVAIGTSLPELVTSIVASKKGQNGMAVGNVVGSNIFNLLMILGVSSSINPIVSSIESVVDISVLLVLSILILIFCRTRGKINRTEGFVMVLLYAAYTFYAIIR